MGAVVLTCCTSWVKPPLTARAKEQLRAPRNVFSPHLDITEDFCFFGKYFLGDKFLAGCRATFKANTSMCILISALHSRTRLILMCLQDLHSECDCDTYSGHIHCCSSFPTRVRKRAPEHPSRCFKACVMLPNMSRANKDMTVGRMDCLV